MPLKEVPKVLGLSPQMALNIYSPHTSLEAHFPQHNEFYVLPCFFSSGFPVILGNYVISDIRLLYGGHM